MPIFHSLNHVVAYLVEYKRLVVYISICVWLDPCHISNVGVKATLIGLNITSTPLRHLIHSPWGHACYAETPTSPYQKQLCKQYDLDSVRQTQDWFREDALVTLKACWLDSLWCMYVVYQMRDLGENAAVRGVWYKKPLFYCPLNSLLSANKLLLRAFLLLH